MELFDTHAHYNDEKFDEDRLDVIKKIYESGVTRVVNAGYDIESSKKALEIAKNYPWMYVICGISPNDIVNNKTGIDRQIEELRKLILKHMRCKEDKNVDIVESDTPNLDKTVNKTEKIVAIGEIGLDYYWNKENKELQQYAFIKQIELANELDLPIVIHTREAVDDTVDILKNRIQPIKKGIFHCCPLNRELVKQVLNMGFYISFAGPVTFKNAKNADEIIGMVPMDRMVIETDSPYLAPEPYRGTRNDSRNVHLVAEKIAKVRNIEVDEVAQKTYENATRIFDRGITLIALVITVVTLVILSTISIFGVLGENGLIAKIEQGKGVHEQAREEEENTLDMYAEYIGKYLPNHDIDRPEEVEKGPNGKPLATEIDDFQSETIYVEDKNGNPITIPGGFKVRKDLGDTVQKGIVIEDGEGNQFVWVPISSIDGNSDHLVILDNGSKVDITLGRYTFNTSTGAPTIKQKASEHLSNKTISDELGMAYQELAKESGTNVVAKDLSVFVSSASRNYGYYIARYEASYGSGNSVSDWKPLSKKSTANSINSMDYTKGTLWNFITQANASAVSQNMYQGHPFVESDLINSYAWDTAIVYIRAMGTTKYAMSNGASKSSLLDTGATDDIKCNIYDMAGNLREWTTETGTSVNLWPCISRGGYYNNSSYYTAYREYQDTSYSKSEISFRPIIYEIENK